MPPADPSPLAVIEEALKEITLGCGAYSHDKLTHAENCIEEMKATARLALSALGRIRGGAEVVATREFKYPPCPHCGKAFAALIAAEVTGVTFNRLGFHLYTDTERERIESIPTKGGRAWTKVLVIPLPPDSEEVEKHGA